MKLRTSFVTNSSSSSFVIIYELKDMDELKEYMRDEYGKYGARLMEEQVKKGKDIDLADYIYSYEDEECDEDDREFKLDDEKYYLPASFMVYSNEGNIEGEDAELANFIPDAFKEVFYEQEPDC